MEAEPEYFGAECSCPGCSQVFRIPAAEAGSEDREALVSAKEERDRLSKILEEVRGQLSSVEFDRKRLAEELAEAVKERTDAKKRLLAQESEVAALKKSLTDADAQAGQYQVLLNERNRLQERIQELNIQNKALEPVPESWVYTGGRNQSNPNNRGGLWWLAAGAFLGAALVIMSSPFLFQRYPTLAHVLKGEDRTLAQLKEELEERAEQMSEAEGLSQKLQKGEGSSKRLPDQFLGFALGQPLGDRWLNEEKPLWTELNGRFQKASDLVGQSVTAVLVPDKEGRLQTGAYVRLCPKDLAELTPFLEWAVSVQDQMSVSWGDPTTIHQIAGVTDISEVVLKIKDGGDYYEAVWGREGEKTRVVLSIRSMSERNVVFRLEYQNVQLSSEKLPPTTGTPAPKP